MLSEICMYMLSYGVHAFSSFKKPTASRQGTKESRINLYALKDVTTTVWKFYTQQRNMYTPLPNNLTTLVDGLYKITTESIKLILNVEQFSDFIVPTSWGTESIIFSFYIMHPH